MGREQAGFHIEDIDDVDNITNLLAIHFQKNGRVYTYGLNLFNTVGLGDGQSRQRPELLPSLDNITHVATNLFHSMAVKNGGTEIYTWGNCDVHIN